MDQLVAALHIGWVPLLVLWASLLVAYIIFGIAGFGTALVAGPVMAVFIPVSSIVPLLALLDFCAAIANLSRNVKAAKATQVRAELYWLVPAMIVGSLAGGAILLLGRPDVLQLALGIFAVGYALYSLAGFKPARAFSQRLALPFGLVGGVFSALFGSGGFIYAIYLAGRLPEPEKIRAAQSALIGMSTLTRALLFLFAGVYWRGDILLLAALLFPAMLIGTWAGKHISIKLSREQFLRLISVVVLCSGGFLVYRYFVHP